MTNAGNIFKKGKRISFFVWRIQICSIFTESTKATNQRQKYGAFFAKVPSIKYVCKNKQNSFGSESPFYPLWEKNGVAKTIDYPFARPLPPSSSYLHEYFIDGI